MGARQGPPVSHVWEPPPPPPPWLVQVASSVGSVLLPLALLFPLLLLFRQNRCEAAWFIWLPVVLTLCLAAVFVLSIVNGEKDVLYAFCSYATGWAAVWLLTPYLKSSHRFLTFLKTWLTLAVFSLLSFCPRFLGSSAGWIDLRPFAAVALPVASLLGAVALVLAGRFVRRRFGRTRYLFWLALGVCIGWNVCALPFVIFSSGKPEWREFFLSTLTFSGVTLGLMLPLLLLSFYHPFYYGRLVSFLAIDTPSAPPLPVAQNEPALTA